MGSDIKLYIPTYDGSAFVLKYFQYFYEKYWNELSVFVLGFNKPVDTVFDKKFSFVEMGKKQENGVNGWSNYLIDFFEKSEDEFFVLGLDDFMVVRDIDKDVFEECLSMIKSDETIGRIELQPTHQFNRDGIEHYKTTSNGIEFIKCSDSSKYRIAAAFSIWRKSWFLKNIERDWSPWEWELQGSKKSNNDGFKVLGTKDRWAIKKIEGLSAKYDGKLNVCGMLSEDLENIKKLVKPYDRVQTFFENEDPIVEGYYFGDKSWINDIFDTE